MLERSLSMRPMLATAEDLSLFKECFEANGDPREPARLRWQYVENPTGRVLVDLALDESVDPHVAAIYATLPVHFIVNGKRATAMQSLDTLTDKRHRGKGLFVDLASRLFARAADSKISFVYGF